jgi:plastocyanin
VKSRSARQEAARLPSVLGRARCGERKELSMKRSLLFAAIAAALVLPLGASAHGSATLTIRHQMRGCHAWSFNGGAFKASQSVTLERGTTLTVTDNDIMSHKLVQVSGPTLRLSASAYMHKMGASTHVVFTKAGVYTFTTKPGEDYFKGMKTIGEDNVLKLKVRVI